MEEFSDFVNISIFPSLSSTNIYAQEQIKAAKITENSVVVAAKQTEGKGQRGTAWLSNPNENLLFSLVFFPQKLKVEDVFYLSKVTSLALCDLVNELTEGQAKIKWPNDIFIGSKKTAGILIENNLLGSRISSSVIGVGLNVNQKTFPPGLNATSLQVATAKCHDLKNLLHRFLLHFKRWIFSEAKGEINSAYLHNLFGYQKLLEFEDQQAVFKGRIVGVAENGLLQIEKVGGKVQLYEIKQIRLRG